MAIAVRNCGNSRNFLGFYPRTALRPHNPAINRLRRQFFSYFNSFRAFLKGFERLFCEKSNLGTVCLQIWFFPPNFPRISPLEGTIATFGNRLLPQLRTAKKWWISRYRQLQSPQIMHNREAQGSIDQIKASSNKVQSKNRVKNYVKVKNALVWRMKIQWFIRLRLCLSAWNSQNRREMSFSTIYSQYFTDVKEFPEQTREISTIATIENCHNWGRLPYFIQGKAVFLSSLFIQPLIHSLRKLKRTECDRE